MIGFSRPEDFVRFLPLLAVIVGQAPEWGLRLALIALGSEAGKLSRGDSSA